MATTTINSFNAREKLLQLQDLQRIRKKGRYSRSRLDRFKNELLQLHACGATLSQIALFLRAEKRTVVARSTILRWLKKHESS